MEQENKIKEILDQLRPYLVGDGGNIEFVKYEDNIVYVRMLGACAHCHMVDVTLKEGVEAAIQAELPEVIEVVNVGLDEIED